MPEDETEHEAQQQETSSEVPWYDANGTLIWSVGPQL